jgi:hypothetical protein
MEAFGACGYLEKYSSRRRFEERPGMPLLSKRKSWIAGYPPPPHTLKAATGAGFAKDGVQNLERLGFKSQR